MWYSTNSRRYGPATAAPPSISNLPSRLRLLSILLSLLLLTLSTLPTPIHATSSLFATWVEVSPQDASNSSSALARPPPTSDTTLISLEDGRFLMWGGGGAGKYWNIGQPWIVNMRSSIYKPAYSLLPIVNNSTPIPVFRVGAAIFLYQRQTQTVWISGGYSADADYTYEAYPDDLTQLRLTFDPDTNDLLRGEWITISAPTTHHNSNPLGPFGRGYAVNVWLDSDQRYILMSTGCGVADGVDYGETDTSFSDGWILDTKNLTWTHAARPYCIQTVQKCDDLNNISLLNETIADTMADLQKQVLTDHRTASMNGNFRGAIDSAQILIDSLNETYALWYKDHPDGLHAHGSFCASACPASNWFAENQPQKVSGSKGARYLDVVYQFGGYSCTTLGVFGRGGPECFNNVIWRYNVTSDSWMSPLTKEDASDAQQELWPSKRAYHSLSLIHHILWIYGGGYIDSSSSIYLNNEVHAFDLLTLQWTHVDILGKKPSPTWSHISFTRMIDSASDESLQLGKLRNRTIAGTTILTESGAVDSTSTGSSTDTSATPQSEMYIFGGVNGGGSEYYNSMSVLLIGTRVRATDIRLQEFNSTAVAGEIFSIKLRIQDDDGQDLPYGIGQAGLFRIQMASVVDGSVGSTTSSKTATTTTTTTTISSTSTSSKITSLTGAGSLNLIDGTITEDTPGVYSCWLTPQQSISSVFVYFDNTLVPGAPFELKAAPGKLTPAEFHITGLGAAGAVKGGEAQITLKAADQYSNAMSKSGLASNFRAMWGVNESVSILQQHELPLDVTDLGTGEYQVKYQVPTQNELQMIGDEIMSTGEIVVFLYWSDAASPLTTTTSTTTSLTRIGQPQHITLYSSPSISVALWTTLIVFTVLSMILLGIMLLLVIVWRQEVIIKSGSPFFLCLILLGGIIGLGSIFTLGEVTRSHCRAFPFVLSIGVTLLLTSLFMKTWRLMTIFNQHRIIKQVRINDARLCIPVAAAVLIEILFNALWVGIHPLSPVLEQSATNQYVTYAVCAYPPNSYVSDLWTGVSIGLKTLLTIYGVFLATATRNLPTQFNESKTQAVVIYNIALSSLIVLPMLYIQPSENLNARFATKAVLILYEILFTCCVLILPRLAPIIHPEYFGGMPGGTVVMDQHQTGAPGGASVINDKNSKNQNTTTDGNGGVIPLSHLIQKDNYLVAAGNGTVALPAATAAAVALQQHRGSIQKRNSKVQQQMSHHLTPQQMSHHLTPQQQLQLQPQQPETAEGSPFSRETNHKRPSSGYTVSLHAFGHQPVSSTVATLVSNGAATTNTTANTSIASPAHVSSIAIVSPTLTSTTISSPTATGVALATGTITTGVLEQRPSSHERRISALTRGLSITAIGGTGTNSPGGRSPAPDLPRRLSTSTRVGTAVGEPNSATLLAPLNEPSSGRSLPGQIQHVF